MASDFTDLSSVVSWAGCSSSSHRGCLADDANCSQTAGKGSDKGGRRRSGVPGRLRLLPIADSSAQSAYEIPGGGGNNSTANNNGGSALIPSKLKVITQKRDLIEAVRKASSPIQLPGREPGSLVRSSSSFGGSSASASELPERDSSQRDIECLEDGVNANARKYNEHRLMVERRQREINTLLVSLRLFDAPPTGHV